MNRPSLASCALWCLAGALYLKMASFTAMLSPDGRLPLPAQIMTLALAGLMVAGLLHLPRAWRGVGLVGVDVLVTLVVLADTAYFRYFGEVLPMSAIAYSQQAMGVGASVGALLKPEDLWLFADFLLLALARPWRAERRSLPALTGALALVVAGCMAHFEYVHPHALEGAWNSRYIASVIGAVPYHVVDGYHTATVRLGGGASDDEVDEMALWFEERRRGQPPKGAPAAGMNLVVLQVEALQGFVIDREVEGRPITPHLNRLAKESYYFPNVYAQTREGNTSDAEFMANTGLYPAPRGAAFVRYAGNSYQALPQALKDQGYTAVAMHANAPGFWNRYRMYQQLGFDRFYSAQDYRQDEQIGLGLSDRAFLTQSAEKLASLPQPFYAWMVTMSSHHPYILTEPHDPLPVGRWAGTQLGHYLDAVHYADAQVGAFLAELERRKLADKTVVVVVGDHPAIQPEHRDDLFRFVGAAGADDATWRHLQKVPLIVHVPGAPAERREVVGGQVDVLPTLARLYGLDFPVAFGQDLLDVTDGFVTFRDGASISQGSLHLAEDDTPSTARSRRHFDLSARILQNDLVPALHDRLSRLSVTSPTGPAVP